jgi:uncharacterized protein
MGLSARQTMLVIPVRDIPPEGKPIDAPLDAQTLHVEGEEEFRLESGRLTGRLEKGDDQSVHFRGHLQARLRLHCGRCLEPFARELDEDLDLFYMPRDAETDEEEQEQDVELSDRDMVVAYYADGAVDLGESVREQVHLAVPLRQLCREDCRGLCPSCGVNRNVATCQCQPAETTDERLAPLRKLFDKGSS